MANKVLMIPWLIDKELVKGIEKRELLKAKYFDYNDKRIVYDFLGYSHSLSILESLSKREELGEIIFFGASAFIGDYKIGQIVYPKKNFIFLKYEDRVSQLESLDRRIEERVNSLFDNIKGSYSMTVDYAGYFPLEEFREIKVYSKDLFIEMEWGFIMRWAKKHNIKAYPFYILTDRWGDKVKINDEIKKKFREYYYKIVEEM